MKQALWCAALVLASAPAVQSGAEPAQRPIEIRVPPLYDFVGPKVQVGAFSEGLASKDRQRFLATVAAMKGRFGELSAESMYVASIRLYDFGMRDAAVYWFYAAQFRATLLETVAFKSEAGARAIAANKEFHASAGRIINGYAFCDLQKLTDTLALVAEQESMPPNLRRIYPGLPLVADRLWTPASLRIAQGYRELSDEIAERWDEIQSKRDSNGMNTRYCRR